jgi:hypothetical protein
MPLSAKGARVRPSVLGYGPDLAYFNDTFQRGAFTSGRLT